MYHQSDSGPANGGIGSVGSHDSCDRPNGLSKSYGPVRAVELVDLAVERGEIYGFVGLNGAGKTTTIRSLLGMVRPDAGSVRMAGQAVGPRPQILLSGSLAVNVVG